MTTTWFRRKRNGKRKIIERDLALDVLTEWNQGPQYPDPFTYDLETVVLHEMGHFVGNHGHVYGCENSPMIDAAAPGEWWRSTTDWLRWSCTGARRAAARRAMAETRPLITKWINVDRTRAPSRKPLPIPTMRG